MSPADAKRRILIVLNALGHLEDTVYSLVDLVTALHEQDGGIPPTSTDLDQAIEAAWLVRAIAAGARARALAPDSD